MRSGRRGRDQAARAARTAAVEYIAAAVKTTAAPHIGTWCRETISAGFQALAHAGTLVPRKDPHGKPCRHVQNGQPPDGLPSLRKPTIIIQTVSRKPSGPFMKQFLVFMVRIPRDPVTKSGGWYDYYGDFDTAEEAHSAASEYCKSNPQFNFQVVDTVLQKIIDFPCD